MAVPVKVSDRLMQLARHDAAGAHRSATAQIEHWATLGRAIEVLAAYRDVLALKAVGRALAFPAFARAEDVREILHGLVESDDRRGVRAHIAGKGLPVYEADPGRAGGLVEVRADGMRVRGRLEGRRFVPDPE